MASSSPSSWSLIPHADIVLTQIRTTDVWLLLAIGALWEFIARLIVLLLKRKPATLLQRESNYKALQTRVEHHRKLGPGAFVETSKLERQLLQLERELQDFRRLRKERIQKVEKLVKKTASPVLSLLVYVAYYGVPVLTLDALEVSNSLGDFVPASTYLKTLLFPVSVIGLGNKLSKWGIDKAVAPCSLSALMVVWSAQVTVGMLMDAVDSYVLLY